MNVAKGGGVLWFGTWYISGFSHTGMLDVTWPEWLSTCVFTVIDSYIVSKDITHLYNLFINSCSRVGRNPMNWDIINHFWCVYLTFDLLSIIFDLSRHRSWPFPRPQHILDIFDPIINHILQVWPRPRRLFSSRRRFPGLSYYTGCVPRPLWVIFLFGPSVLSN